ANIEIEDIQHIKLCGDKNTYCGHPRQGGIFNFGQGELAVVHFHAPCAYQRPEDVRHDYGGYHSRSVVLLQRSLDGGQSWPKENNVVIYNEAAPLEERRRFLFSNQSACKHAQAGLDEREAIHMCRPESIFYFGRTWASETKEDGTPGLVCFSLRSADKGKTWEKVPTIISPPPGRDYCHKDNHPPVRMPDGSFLGAMTVSPPGTVALYGSDDDGLTWEYLAEIARDPTGLGRPTYAGLILLPNGRLQCYMLNIRGLRNAICMNYSDDGGYSWSLPRPVVRWDNSPWRTRRQKDRYGGWGFYRSPWPMLLRDGRLLVLFARRKPPYGIGGIVSEDQGATCSREFIIRDDGSGPDLGYPVATELDDGRIFTAYYFMVEDGNRFGGSRFIGGSFFRIK
ncbi:MAG: sialidase family protein, partial [bacterium]